MKKVLVAHFIILIIQYFNLPCRYVLDTGAPIVKADLCKEKANEVRHNRIEQVYPSQIILKHNLLTIRLYNKYHTLFIPATKNSPSALNLN
ncbi:hypothetical protein [Parabacteroides pacaensis]|uniref:hypothetical protein n=1 Tax=Parabacteroides pacaensis TaxID=2086575 RepID=UPI000D0FA37E|nr:hypothetical protein [Parabacteroides pacaensis]